MPAMTMPPMTREQMLARRDELRAKLAARQAGAAVSTACPDGPQPPPAEAEVSAPRPQFDDDGEEVWNEAPALPAESRPKERAKKAKGKSKCTAKKASAAQSRERTAEAASACTPEAKPAPSFGSGESEPRRARTPSLTRSSSVPVPSSSGEDSLRSLPRPSTCSPRPSCSLLRPSCSLPRPRPTAVAETLPDSPEPYPSPQEEVPAAGNDASTAEEDDEAAADAFFEALSKDVYMDDNEPDKPDLLPACALDRTTPPPCSSTEPSAKDLSLSTGARFPAAMLGHLKNAQSLLEVPVEARRAAQMRVRRAQDAGCIPNEVRAGRAAGSITTSSSSSPGAKEQSPASLLTSARACARAVLRTPRRCELG